MAFPGAAQAAGSSGDNRPTLTARAQRVLDALLHFAHRDLSWPMPRDAAAWLDVSVDTFRRGVDELLEKRYIEQPSGMRVGKARVFRFLPVESPQDDATSPQPAVPVTTAGAPLGATPAVIRPLTASPQEDRTRDEEFDNFEWTPEKLDDCAERARTIYERLAFGAPLPEAVVAGPGICDDCLSEVTWRAAYGKVEVCRSCRARRASAAMKLAAEVTR